MSTKKKVKYRLFFNEIFYVVSDDNRRKYLYCGKIERNRENKKRQREPEKAKSTPETTLMMVQKKIHFERPIQ